MIYNAPYLRTLVNLSVNLILFSYGCPIARQVVRSQQLVAEGVVLAPAKMARRRK